MKEEMDEIDQANILAYAKAGSHDLNAREEAERIKKIVECPRCAHVYRLMEVYCREFKDSTSKIARLRWKVRFYKNSLEFYKSKSRTTPKAER